MSSAPDSAVRDIVGTQRERFLDDLEEWLRIPSVSADPGLERPWAAPTTRGTGKQP
jgi:hypothetical protein